MADPDAVVVSCAVIFPAHTSSAVLVFMASWVMMLIGRVRLGELVKLIGLACIGIVFIMTLNLGRSETAEGRVSTWIHLWTRSQTEKPIEHLTDTERSMIAIHNGGVFGEGAGQSAMRVEMIHPESDYAYAFFVEEYGIVLALALLMLYLWIFFRGIEIFRRCGTAFPGLLVLGLALLITCQALLHIMVTVNLIPETGQTLPLISRGGSSTIFTTIALGMILSVSRQNDEQSTIRPAANPFTKNNTVMDDIRLDKYLWAVRVFKTRSDAADAIRNNKVTVNGSAAKPSREVKVGDVIAVRKMQVTYSYRVLDLVSSRQPAKNVPLYCLNITPQEELDKLSIPRETIFVFRDRGTGRPTKKERRELDGLMDGIYYDGDE